MFDNKQERPPNLTKLKWLSPPATWVYQSVELPAAGLKWFPTLWLAANKCFGGALSEAWAVNIWQGLIIILIWMRRKKEKKKSVDKTSVEGNHAELQVWASELILSRNNTSTGRARNDGGSKYFQIDLRWSYKNISPVWWCFVCDITFCQLKQRVSWF